MLILELRPFSWEIKTGEIPHCKSVQITLPAAVFFEVQVLVIGGFNFTSLEPRVKGKARNDVGVSINIQTGRIGCVRAVVQFKGLVQISFSLVFFFWGGGAGVKGMVIFGF